MRKDDVMWIKLDLEGIDFHFRISKYRKSTKENGFDEWCEVDLTLQAREWLNYQIVSDETLLAVEVEEIRDRIDNLLNGSLEKPEKIECIEPDLEFHLHPKEDIRNNPDVVYVKPGYEIADIDMDLIVSFWDRDGALSANRLLLSFGREDLEKLLCYLQYVTGVINKEDVMVKELIAEGCVYG